MNSININILVTEETFDATSKTLVETTSLTNLMGRRPDLPDGDSFLHIDETGIGWNLNGDVDVWTVEPEKHILGFLQLKFPVENYDKETKAVLKFLHDRTDCDDCKHKTMATCEKCYENEYWQLSTQTARGVVKAVLEARDDQ